ncbi:MAG: sodium:solute symporter [Bacteroidia bacterium]|nr:sodium:solute symporter [Bacteroidia bacterium]
MGFTYFDAAVIVVYLVGVAAFGMFMGGRQTSARDYFLSDKAVPWWAVCLTIVATETSALTFLSLPGVAWGGSMVFLQLAGGYILGRLLVAWIFIPRYFDGKLDTAYALIEHRFGGGLRRASSFVFMITRLFADGVRLYATAIPLALLLHNFEVLPEGNDTMIYLISLTFLTILTLVYVFAGGIRAVIWADVMQWVVYILGALASIVVLFHLLPGNPVAIVAELVKAGKLTMVDLMPENGVTGIFTTPYTLLGGLFGGAVLSMASHGTDQLIVQRVLAAQKPEPAKRAMIWSGIIVFVQFFLFLFVGALLWRFNPDGGMNANDVFAVFIIHQLPPGLTGLVIAGILAAAMSTLSSSISALGSATMMDYVLPLLREPLSPARALRVSRLLSIGWAILLLLTAALFIGTAQTVVELALSIASYTYGGLLGIFLLGVLRGHYRSAAVLIGFIAGIIASGCIILLTPLAWTWYTPAGAAATVAAAWLANSMQRTGTKETKA